jgi:tripartite-type tricarboxylate transporter receptor subunit TctC
VRAPGLRCLLEGLKRARRPAAGLGMIAFAAAAAAQGWPAKAVRLVVPYPPGGGNDILARLIAPRMSERWGQSVVIDNRPGAAGNLGAGEVARSPADGYTLLMATSTLAMTPGLGQKVSYELERDLTAVAMVGSTAMVIAVHPEVPAKTLRELIALAKAQPGKLAYSTCGNASPMHLAGELFKLSAGIDLLHVPYKGCAPALTDVIGGQIPIAFNTISNTASYERAGRIRILAVASAQRLAEFPNIPTASEQGMTGYEADIWFGLFAPAQTPRGAVEAVNAAVNQALSDSEVRDRMRAQFFDPRPGSAEAFAAFVRSEVVKWGRTIRDADIKAD